MMDYEKTARELFMEGYNCAQAVFMAFTQEKLGKETAAKIASAMGGGISGMREVCGAVSGMALAYGYLRGYSDAGDMQGKREEYKVIQGLAEEFQKENGSIVCRQLLGLDPNFKPQMPEARTAEYYKKRPCPEMVACAARILGKYLEEHPAEG